MIDQSPNVVRLPLELAQEELDTVAQLGVHLVQGYLMGRPMAMPAKRQGRSMQKSIRHLSGALTE